MARTSPTLPPAQRGVAMVFQNYALFPHLNVADNITFGLSVRKVPAAQMAGRLAETADLLGLTPLLQRKPSQLSGGQQQRVALARALVAQAKVCLMDEPLSNLDAQLRQEMRTRVARVAAAPGPDSGLCHARPGRGHEHGRPGGAAQQGPCRAGRNAPDTLRTARHDFCRQFHRHAGHEPAAGGRRPYRRQRGFGGTRRPPGWVCGPNPSALGGDVPATVRGLEYLGADLVLRCASAPKPSPCAPTARPTWPPAARSCCNGRKRPCTISTHWGKESR
jgi:sn-glycerol 3-phosphate transport system ATP-binding protein